MQRETLTLLGYQRAEHQIAESRQSVTGKIEVAILTVASIGLLAPSGQYALLAALISLLLGLGWQLFAWLGRRSHDIAERARRAVVLDVALDIPLTGKAFSDLHANFSASQSTAAGYEDTGYYASSRPSGHGRLADILEESAFWSKHLFRAAATRSWILLAIFVVVAVACLVLLALSPAPSARILSAQAVCVMLSWLVAGSMLSDAAAYSSASIQMDDVESRLESMLETADNLLPIFGDYNAIVQTAPTIPTNIYRKKKDALGALWQARPKVRNSDPVGTATP